MQVADIKREVGKNDEKINRKLERLGIKSDISITSEDD
jgi:hypothetical protein